MNSNPPYFLTSKRLGFRTWTEKDVHLAERLWGDPKVTQYIDSRNKLTPDDIRLHLENEISQEKRFHLQYWPIFLIDTNGHIGCCGLRPYDMPQGIYEIGFHIRSNHWRRGYAREAAMTVIDYAFNTLEVNGLFAGHNPRNSVSQHLLQQLGFRFTHHEYYPPTGLDHPSYALNASEYSSSKSGSGSNC